LVEDWSDKPISPSAFMRGLRPEYYSDTEDRTTIVLEREVLEHHLATITNRNETQAFELFCRKLCERTLSPNLRPATGPHGGGDSKADTETIPVSEEVSALWYVGDQSAAKERWAFAFSAKKTWAAKVRSDVSGLVERNRGYRRLICVTSQFAADRARAKLEDELTRQHGIPITILDRSWIVKEVVENDRKDLAFDYLGIGHEVRDARRLGPRDYSRTTRLEALEKEIDDPAAFDGIERQRAAEALVAAKLSRSLERPRVDTDGRFQRAIRLAEAHGSYRQKLEAHYEALWTAYWWFDDVTLVNRCYQGFAQLVLPSDHARNLQFLSNVLQLLFNSVMLGHLTVEECELEARAQRAESRFKEVADQPERPNNSIEMRMLLLILSLNRAMLARDQQAIAALWPQLSTLLEEGKGLVEFGAARAVKFIEVVGPVAGSDPNYDRVVEQVAEFMAERTSEAEGALVRLKRAKQLDFDRKFDMIRLLGRAARQLTKKEYADQLIEATQLLALAYRSAGLLWAARASCVFAMASICIESEEESELRVAIVPTVQLWAWISLELRHLPDFFEAIQLLNGMLKALPLADESKALLKERLNDLDLAFASQILNFTAEELKQMERMPTALGSLSMFGSRMALLYALGYEAALRQEDTLPAHENAATVKEFFERLASQPVSEDAAGPLIVNGSGQQTYASRVIGMTLEAVFQGTECSILVAEAVLAASEAFFATAGELEVIPHTERVSVEIIEDDAAGEPSFAFDRDEMRGRVIWPSGRSPASSSANGQTQRLLIETAATFMGATCHVEDPGATLKRLAEDEAVLDRIGIISVTGNSYHRFLSCYVLRLSDRAALTGETFPIRDGRPQIERKKLERRAKAAAEGASISANPKPPLGDDHRKMAIRSVINGHLWDQAGWNGTLYATSKPGAPPLLGLIFTNEDMARKIFAGWRERFGKVDTGDEIHISIVRGVSEKNPHHYVIIITSKLPELDELTGADNVIFAIRRQSMQPASSVNLDRFLTAYRSEGRYVLLPAISRAHGPELAWDSAIGKQKLTVKQADEIGPGDIERIALKMPVG
jgi:hypothetical protein